MQRSYDEGIANETLFPVSGTSQASPLRPQDFVRRGSVHSAVYTSEAVFELELERIFYRSWMYVGHESEIRAPGDYRLRQIGRQPVILVRGKDGVARVLMNRCRHRGALVCEIEGPPLEHFRCWYHGWTYENTGELIHVPGEDAYGAEFSCERFSLTPAPRVESYRGFVFASLHDGVPSLTEHLGAAAAMIDVAIDASPTGTLTIEGGSQKTTFKGNWKLVGMDGYHPNYLHVSVMTNRARKQRAEQGSAYRDPWSDASDSRTRAFPNGHNMLDLTAHRLGGVEPHLAMLRKISGGDEYIQAMYRSYGTERATRLLVMNGDPHLGLFPNVQLINSHVRIIHPVAAGETEVTMYPTRLGGVSDAINEQRLRRHESFYGPAGSGSPDDAEIFERVQRGLHAAVDPWIDLSRGIDRERADSDGSVVGLITDELPQRSQLTRWRELMAAGA